MYLKNYEVNKFVLLTGAGFTHNFGGFLAKDIEPLIFNNIKNYPRIKEIMHNNFFYESIYHEVIEGDFTEDEKNFLTNAIRDAYKKLDERILAYEKLANDQPVDIPKVNQFIERFAGHHKRKGFFFTLNQDLFIERYYNSLNYGFATLGVPKKPIHRRPLEINDYIQLPSTVETIQNNRISDADFFYVKMHGSYNWKSHDGCDKMVIGRDKKTQIEKEPILYYYLDCFEEILLIPNIKLFVIGYGFRDEHINEVIANSIEKTNLELYVMNPLEREKFQEDMQKNKPYGDKIVNGLAGYYPYTLLQVFPGAETIEYKLIRDSYFNC